MDDKDFLEGLKSPEDKDTEWAAAAEEFVRLTRIFPKEDEEEKTAFVIQPEDRPEIPKKDFAQPTKEEEGHEGKYPIPDKQHARSALGFAKMHHDSGALAAVRAKIHKKFPGMLHKDKDKQDKTASAIAELLTNKRALPYIIGGALLMGAGTGLASRPKKELGGKSQAESELNKAVERQQEEGEEGAGFGRKMKNRFTEASRGFAKTFREHPIKASLIGGGAGASLGATIARILGAGK
jgi:hypothetical protein